MLFGVLPDSSLCQNDKQVEIITKMIFELCYIEAIIKNKALNFIYSVVFYVSYLGSKKTKLAPFHHI